VARANVKDRLYVGNLHPTIGEDDVRIVLSPFGTIDSVKLHKDEIGQSRGFCFVKFARVEDAATALAKIEAEGLELMGRQIKVGYVTDNAGLTGAAAPGAASGNWKLDEDDGRAGFQLDAASRLALMQRLGGGVVASTMGLPGMPLPGMGLPGMPMPMGMPMALAGGAPAVLRPPGAPLPPPPAVPVVPPVVGAPAFTVVIKNMFDPATETEPNWAEDIKEDTQQECSKFGSVLHMYVEARRPGGLVFVVFGTTASASKAVAHLHGRWFAGRTITVEYIAPAAYAAALPDAAPAIERARAGGQ
jgi:RNA-binding protein 39